MSRFALAILLFLASCSKDTVEPNPYSGREFILPMQQGADFPISGTATFKELKTGELELTILLTGTDGDIYHPTHLHYGAYTPDAEMAALLSPVYGATGESITVFNKLGNETPFGFDDLQHFDGHIKVHQDDGPNKSVILAYGLVGTGTTSSNGRMAVNSITLCKSN